MNAPLYTLKSAEPPWGDYGSILWHGLVEEASSDAAPLVLYRTGPFVPPISFPWPTVVVTEAVRAQLCGEDFRGYVFRRVEARRVVELSWEQWDSNADDPREYPAGGEPENYLVHGRHSVRAASAFPSLHELHVPETSGLQLEGGAVDPAHYSGEDICRGNRFGYIYVSERLKDWLEREVGSWIACTRARMAG
jgi:hypothetical protein